MPKLGERQFTPQSLEETFALYLSRELDDVLRVRWYARLTREYSMCLLLNALRKARTLTREDQVEPERFLYALKSLLAEEHRI